MGKRDEGGEVDQRLVRALCHPLRAEILRILGEQPASPVQLSKILETPLGNISYHTKVLVEYDCIELIETRPARRAVEHIYRAKPQATMGARRWQKAPRSLRNDVVGAALDGFNKRAIEALEAGTFQEREGAGITWLPLRVDETGWREILGVLKSVETRFLAVADKSSERLDDLAQGIAVIVAMAAFETGGERGRFEG